MRESRGIGGGSAKLCSVPRQEGGGVATLVMGRARCMAISISGLRPMSPFIIIDMSIAGDPAGRGGGGHLCNPFEKERV